MAGDAWVATLFLPLLACAGTATDTSIPASTLEWLSPSGGETVAAGDVSCSIVIDHFTLWSPAKGNEGEPIGYFAVRVDDAAAIESASTVFSLTIDAGAHDLTAQLYYADGDPVLTADDAVCDATSDATCDPVVSTIHVTAE